MTATPRTISIGRLAQEAQQIDSHKATGYRPGQQPQQVGPVDLANGARHQQYAESHLQAGFDRNDELQGKEQGQQGDAEQRPAEPGKGSEEKGKQNDGLSGQQGRIHGVAGLEPSWTKQRRSHTTNGELSPLPAY